MLLPTVRSHARPAAGLPPKTEFAPDGGLRKRPFALGALALLIALYGCKANDFNSYNMGSSKRTRAEKVLHPAQNDPGSMNLPDIKIAPSSASSQADAGGDNADSTKDTAGDALDMGSEEALETSYTGDSHERTHSWWGVFDIYWMLNGARRQLLTGEVPRDLPAIVGRERKHSERLAHENLDYKPDPFWKFSPSLTIAACLEPADDALTHLDSGISHLKQRNAMEAAGVSARSIPWGMGVDEVRRALERLGLAAPPARRAPASLSRRSDDDDSGSAPSITYRFRPEISDRQQQAAALALRYEKEYRASPEECARKDFEEALRATLKLRDLLNLRHVRTRDHLMNNNVVITGPLRMDSSALSAPGDAAAPKTSAVFDDPFKTP